MSPLNQSTMKKQLLIFAATFITCLSIAAFCYWELTKEKRREIEAQKRFNWELEERIKLDSIYDKHLEDMQKLRASEIRAKNSKVDSEK